jgi:hypothetical protein
MSKAKSSERVGTKVKKSEFAIHEDWKQRINREGCGKLV